MRAAERAGWGGGARRGIRAAPARPCRSRPAPRPGRPGLSSPQGFLRVGGRGATQRRPKDRGPPLPSASRTRPAAAPGCRAAAGSEPKVRVVDGCELEHRGNLAPGKPAAVQGLLRRGRSGHAAKLDVHKALRPGVVGGDFLGRGHGRSLAAARGAPTQRPFCLNTALYSPRENPPHSTPPPKKIKKKQKHRTSCIQKNRPCCPGRRRRGAPRQTGRTPRARRRRCPRPTPAPTPAPGRTCSSPARTAWGWGRPGPATPAPPAPPLAPRPGGRGGRRRRRRPPPPRPAGAWRGPGGRCLGPGRTSTRRGPRP